jgi:hypothetical protein
MLNKLRAVPAVLLVLGIVAGGGLLGHHTAARPAAGAAPAGAARQKDPGEELRRRLNAPISVDFRDTPLTAVVAQFKSATCLNIRIDRRALRRHDIPLDTPITARARNVSVRTALKLCLQGAGLSYTLRAGAVVVTVRERRPPAGGGAGAGPGGIVVWRQPAPGEAYLTAVRPDDRKERRLTTDPGEGQATFPQVLSPDGRWVAYSRGEVEGDTPRFKVYVRRRDRPREAGRCLGVDGYCACWSPDGRHVVVVHDEGGTFAHSLVDVKTAEKKAIPLPAADAPPDAAGPVGHIITDWSPDGRWFLTMCLTGDAGRAKRRLYLVRRDGSEAKRLAGVEWGAWGRFSPDGKRVLYAGPDEKGRPAVFAVASAGGRPVRLSQERNGSVGASGGFCWSPDGKRVAYLWCDAQTPRVGVEYEVFLMVVDADGTNPTTLLSQKSRSVLPIRYPQWR